MHLWKLWNQLDTTALQMQRIPKPAASIFKSSDVQFPKYLFSISAQQNKKVTQSNQGDDNDNSKIYLDINGPNS